MVPRSVSTANLPSPLTAPPAAAARLFTLAGSKLASQEGGGGVGAAVVPDGAPAVAVDGAAGGGGPPVHLGGLEAGVAVAPEQLTELAVVEGREGPRQPVAGVAVRRVHQQRIEALA